MNKQIKVEPYDDAMTRILKRMWNCRGKHNTSIDKVKMEQILRDELSSVNPQPKTGRWEKTTDGYCYWYKCFCCGTKAPKNEWGSYYFSPYCPECGARMVEPQESEDEE